MVADALQERGHADVPTGAPMRHDLARFGERGGAVVTGAATLADASKWQAARLIPTSGINGVEEQERRATSALLAVVVAVREFGRTLLQPLGAPAGTIEAFIEVPFDWHDKTVYPDGVIRVSRGARSWTALIEVKTANNDLKTEQIEAYLDVAREQGFDAVLTISNQIPPAPGVHPTVVDKRKIKKVALHHLPWIEVLSEAFKQKEHRGVADPDQAWILGELIRYLEHTKSGAMAFEDMGQSWVPTREAVRAGTLRAGDKSAADVIARFDALLRYAGLRLGQRLGADVNLVLSRKEAADPGVRAEGLRHELVERGSLSGTLRIPNTAADLIVVADLRANQIACSCDLGAPKEGRPRTRVNWLVRQLRDADENLRIEAYAAHSRGGSTAELLGTVRDNPDVLIADPAKELRSFRVTRMTSMGIKRGAGRGGFIDSVLDSIDDFYAGVLQNLKEWTPPAPKLPSAPRLGESAQEAAVVPLVEPGDAPSVTP